MFLDEVAGLGEFVLVGEQAGAVEVDVGEVQRHRASLGDQLGFVQEVRRRGPQGIGKGPLLWFVFAMLPQPGKP